MTAPFRRFATCKKCGTRVPLEDDIGQWIRNHPQLDSGKGFAFMDKDIVAHLFKRNNDREFQCLMFIEFKSYGRDLDDSQRDTMILVDQLFRNDRTTPTKKERLHIHSISDKAYSSMNRRKVGVKAFGYHLVRLSGNTPEDSTRIKWDKREIDLDTLVKLLRFELNPDTLRPMDFRIHHPKDEQVKLL